MYKNINMIIPDNIEEILEKYHIDSLTEDEVKIANVKYLCDLGKKGVIKASLKEIGDEFGMSNSLVSNYEKNQVRADIKPKCPKNLHYYFSKFNPERLTKEQLKWSMVQWVYEKKESGFFKPVTGAIHCENATVDVLLHETGHALHYYLAENKVPDNYTEIVERARNNPEMLVKVELLANKYKEIMDKVKISVEKKYQEQFENYYTEEKRMEIYNILMKSKDEKKEEYKKLGIPNEQLDTILEGTYTVGEYINHQKRIFIKENVTAIMDNEFNSIAAICDILDAIYEGKLHNSELKSMKGDNIKGTAGHGINYYFDTNHGFDEMIANFATLSKSNNADEMLNLLKSIVGEEVYNMISDFYYQNIIQVNNEELNVNKGYGGK